VVGWHLGGMAGHPPKAGTLRNRRDRPESAFCGIQRTRNVMAMRKEDRQMTDGPKTRAAPKDIIQFWFSPETRPHWFVASDAFDAEVRERFGDYSERASAGELDDWARTPEGSLALILLLDQVPRNIHRHTAEAFRSDGKALALAKKAVSVGFDKGVGQDERLFFYLPFQHAEDRAIQDEAVRLVEALGNEENANYARRHRDIIHRFGRFPHRNAQLGRTSTEEEIEFLKQPGSSF
jgi:uncharacterized protein (DUF924 family)